MKERINNADNLEIAFGRVGLFFSFASIVIALMGLIGYLPGLYQLGSIKSTYIPMAPSTAVSFLIFSIILVAYFYRLVRGTLHFVVLLISGITLIFGFIKFIEYFISSGISFEQWFVHIDRKLGDIPVGIMSWSTGLGLFIAGIGIICFVLYKRNKTQIKVLKNITGILGLIVFVYGNIFAMSYYFYKNPLLYGANGVVPMALTTALAFICLGIGILTIAGPKALPQRILIGQSTRAVLARTFTLLIIVFILAEDFLPDLISKKLALNNAVIDVTLLLTYVLIGVLVVIRISSRLGHKLDQVQKEVKSIAKFPAENPNAVLRVAKDGEILYTNDAAKEVLKAWGWLFDKNVPKKWQQIIEESLKTGKKKLEEEINNRILSFEVVPIKETNYINLYAREITEYKKSQQALREAYKKLKDTQEQLIQTGKMAAMGQLAAGISHELNQPLTVIKGFAQVMLLDIDSKSLFGEDLIKIIEQADHMDEIIKNVRSFARKSKFKMKLIKIDGSIDNALSLMSEQLRINNIEVVKEFGNELPQINGDTNQLQQVFINLLSNAKDAIKSLEDGDGGQINIKVCLNRDGNKIRIVIQDTGCGIPEEIMKDIFNPFFTTKSPDGGMGLGLSIAYRIIEEHSGTISCVSQEGVGTNFVIYLPVAKINNFSNLDD